MIDFKNVKSTFKWSWKDNMPVSIIDSKKAEVEFERFYLWATDRVSMCELAIKSGQMERVYIDGDTFLINVVTDKCRLGLAYKGNTFTPMMMRHGEWFDFSGFGGMHYENI